MVDICMIVSDFLVGQVKIIYRRQAVAMLCRLSPFFSGYFQRWVIHDGIKSGIADHTQIWIFIHNPNKVLFCILDVKEEITFFSERSLDMT